MPELADQQLTDFIASFNALDLPPASVVGADGLRAAATERVATRPQGPDLARVADLAIPAVGVPMRLYRPTSDPTPVAVYLHGGGWVIGDLATHDRACRRLAATSESPSSLSTTAARRNTSTPQPSTMPWPRCAGWPPRRPSSVRSTGAWP